MGLQNPPLMCGVIIISEISRVKPKKNPNAVNEYTLMKENADLHDRSVIASITDKNITADLAIRTLKKALASQGLTTLNLILHSDQCSQFTSK